MPLSLRRGRVGAVLERLPGLVRLEVDSVGCVAYPQLTGEVEEGDDVLVNVQARELELGSGGFDVLYANLTRGLELPPADGAHVMKLPYTPVQHAVRHLEEEDGEVPAALDGLPVVLCTLHSQLLPVLAGLGGELRIAYVQVPGGALPVDLSDAVRTAKERFDLVSIAVGSCFGGDHDAVSVAYALAWSAWKAFDVAVCAVGPGIVGTGVALGHGALAVADAGNTINALGGTPVLVPRLSTGDERARHRGVSHHTRSVLALSLGEVHVAWPSGVGAPEWLEQRVEVDATSWRTACSGLPISTMGRGADDEPGFFAAAYAGGLVAAEFARVRRHGVGSAR